MTTTQFELHRQTPGTLRGRLKRKVFLWTSVGIILWISVFSIVFPNAAETTKLTRKLLSSSECSSSPDWIKNGGIALLLIGVLFLFLGIAIVCDEYFVASLDAISKKLGLSKDVAGATFMAAGSSAPELFSAFVAITNDAAANDIGVGTIVGSAVFNILVIIGVTALFSGQILHLDYRPLVRDAIFYALAIGGVIGIFHDGKVHWWEGLISVLAYGLYIITMKYNSKIMEYLPAIPDKNRIAAQESSSGQNSATELVLPTHRSADEAERGSPRDDKNNIEVPTSDAGPSTAMRTQNSQAGHADVAYSEDDSSFFSQPEGCGEKIVWALSLLWRSLFYITIPDCKKTGCGKWYMATFMISIIWIGVISWFMVEWTADIGCVLGIPSAIMGVTVLAAGTSIPDALSSIAVAKRGEGDMAIANAVGSNVFDIWLGLGLPWLLAIPFKEDGSDGYGKYITVKNNELLPNVLILFGVLAFYLIAVIVTKWKLFPKEGYLFVVIYILYAIYNIVGVWLFDIYNTEDDD